MRTEGAAVAAVLVALTLLDVALAAAMDKKGLPRGSRRGCWDMGDECSTMPPGRCYTLQDRNYCCETCESYERELSAGEGCEYGDGNPDFCRFVTYRHCKSSFTRGRCCATCAKVMNRKYGENMSR